MKTAVRKKGKLENFEEEYRSALCGYAAGEASWLWAEPNDSGDERLRSK